MAQASAIPSPPAAQAGDQDGAAQRSSCSLDIVGPDRQALPQRHEPLLSAIAAAAAHSDRQGVPRTRLDALAASGLLGKPLEPAALQRELAERLFMADGSLTFCWLQHQMPLRRLLSAAATAEAPAAAELKDGGGSFCPSAPSTAAQSKRHPLISTTPATPMVIEMPKPWPWLWLWPTTAEGCGATPTTRSTRAPATAQATAQRCSSAIAGGGAAMHEGTPAKRRLREAAFLLVQAQTAQSHQASLQLLCSGTGTGLTPAHHNGHQDVC